MLSPMFTIHSPHLYMVHCDFPMIIGGSSRSFLVSSYSPRFPNSPWFSVVFKVTNGSQRFLNGFLGRLGCPTVSQGFIWFPNNVFSRFFIVSDGFQRYHAVFYRFNNFPRFPTIFSGPKTISHRLRTFLAWFPTGIPNCSPLFPDGLLTVSSGLQVLP